MIKFTAKGKERQLVGLGITEENVKRLKAGQPVFVKLKELNLQTDIEVAIFYGQDEEAIYRLLKTEGFIGKETKIMGNVPVDADVN